MAAQQGKMKSPVPLSTDLDFCFNFACPFPFPFPSPASPPHTLAIWNWPARLSLCNPQLRVNRHMFLRGTFSLRPQGSRGRGVLFSPPTQNIHTGRLCEMCARRIYVRRPHWHANVFRTDEPQLAQCGRGQQSGLTWNRTAGKEINDTA